MFRFDIPAGSVRDALVRVTVTVNGSLGGELAACDGATAGFRGVATLPTAVDAILRGSPCASRIGEGNAILVRVAKRPRGPTAAPPAPPRRNLADQTLAVTVTGSRPPDGDPLRALQRTRLQGDEFTPQAMQSVSDLAPLIVGMAATNLGPGRNKILLRGLSDGVFPGEATATVALYLDDAPLNYAEKDPGLRLVDIDEVEVVRGPQARSPNAIGGAIVIRPTPPDLDRFGGFLSAAANTVSRGGRGDETDLVMNLPVAAHKDAVRAVLYDAREPGYVRDRLATVTSTNTSESRGGRVENLWRPWQGWRVETDVVWQRLHVADSQYVFEPLSGFVRNNRLAEPSDNNATYLINTVSGAIGEVRVRWTTSYSNHTLAARYDATQSLPNFGLTTAIPATFDASRKLETEVTTVSLRGGPEGLKWRAGGTLAVERDHDGSLFDLVNDPANPLYQDVRRDSRSDVSGYGGATLALTDRLDLDVTASLFQRRQWVRADAVNDAGAVVGKPFTTKLEHKGLEPAIGVIYAATADLTLIARVSQADRPAGVNTGVLLAKRPAGATPYQANRTYSGDRVRLYELDEDFKARAFGLDLRLAQYVMTWKNVQADEFSIYNTPITVNIGQGDLSGVEFDGRLELGSGFRLTGLVDAEHAGLSGSPTRAYFSGAYGGLVGAPHYNGALTLSRQGRHGTLGWRWAAGWVTQGPSRVTFDGLTASNLRGFSSVNLSTEFSMGRWAVFGAVTNAGDQRGDTLAFGNPFSTQRNRQITPQRPRQVTVGLRRSF